MMGQLEITNVCKLSVALGLTVVTILGCGCSTRREVEKKTEESKGGVSQAKIQQLLHDDPNDLKEYYDILGVVEDAQCKKIKEKICEYWKKKGTQSVASGKSGMQGAPLYEPGASPHRILFVDKKGSLHDWSFICPREWQPNSINQVQLIAVIQEEFKERGNIILLVAYDSIGKLVYDPTMKRAYDPTDPTMKRSKQKPTPQTLKTFSHHITVQVRHSKTSELVAEETFVSFPRAPVTKTIYESELPDFASGDVSFHSDVQPWLEAILKN